MKIRTLFSVAIIAALLIGLAACNGKKNDNQASKQENKKAFCVSTELMPATSLSEHAQKKKHAESTRSKNIFFIISPSLS